MRIMPGGALEQDQELSGPSSVFVGRKLDDYRGAFVLEYPMNKGRVMDGGWDSMERVWEVRFTRCVALVLVFSRRAHSSKLFACILLVARVFQK
jgi:hypothetical protein